MIHMFWILVVAGLATLALVTSGAAQTAVAPGGVAPTVVTRTLSSVPNEQAITRRFWVPGLDAGFVPQGMAFQGGSLVLGGYISTDPQQSKGPCRLYWIDPASGAARRSLNLPSSCGHAGGLAALADGRIVVADTERLFVVAGGRVTATIELGGALRGSFADFDGKDLWIGSYGRGGGSLWRLPLSVLGQGSIDPSAALTTLSAPAGAQGLAFDRSGQMWLTTSGSRNGAILRLDKATGQTLASYDAPAGIEDIAFDGAGRLWASSEAGSRRWSGWSTFYPLVFAIDLERLR
jgi:sugar lactone lactonase YvrE